MNRLVIFTLIATLAFSCTSYETITDYNPNINFGSYKSYCILKEKNNKAQSLYSTCIYDAINSYLQNKGLFNSKYGDLLVKVDMTIKQKKHIQSQSTAITRPGFYYKNHYHRYRYSNGFTTTARSIELYPEGTVIVRVIDRFTKEVVWEGIAQGIFNGKDFDKEKTSELIGSVLIDFPPKKEEQLTINTQQQALNRRL